MTQVYDEVDGDDQVEGGRRGVGAQLRVHRQSQTNLRQVQSVIQNFSVVSMNT